VSRLNVRLTSFEQAQLEKQSKSHKMTISEYVRLQLFDSATLEARIGLSELIGDMQAEISNINNQLETIGLHLAEHQKSLTMVLNTLFQFMAVDIGADRARQVFTDIKNKMEDEQDGK